MKKNMQLARQLHEIHEQWARDNGYRKKRQAPSVKLQASSAKLLEERATSVKRQAQRLKRQATSVKLMDH